MKTKEKHNTMNTTTITIDKAKAELYLKFNFSNRPYRDTNEGYFAKLIQQGEFLLSHQGIAFEGSPQNPKRLLDGQHRLGAIALTGIPTPMQVSWNCDPGLYEATDCGATRTFKDLHGWSPALSSLVKAIHDIKTGKNWRMSMFDAGLVMDAFGDQIAYLLKNASATKKGISTASTRAGIVLLMKRNPEQAEEIVDAYRALLSLRFELMAPIVMRYYSRMITQDGGGKKVREVRLLSTWKALNPKNWEMTMLKNYRYPESKLKEIQAYVINEIEG